MTIQEFRALISDPARPIMRSDLRTLAALVDELDKRIGAVEQAFADLVAPE